MLNSFNQAVNFKITNGLFEDFKNRIKAVCNETKKKDWFNTPEFEAIIKRLK
jgi:hypothetical protein